MEEKKQGTKLGGLSTGELVTKLIDMDRKRAKIVGEIDRYKAEISARGGAVLDDTNTKFVKYYGENGSCAVTFAEKLFIADDLRLREMFPEGVYDKLVTVTSSVKYKYDSKLETALKAIFSGEYLFDMTMQEYLCNSALFPLQPDVKQVKLLLKKLTGDYKKDNKLLASMFGAGSYDEELLYIHRIRNGELIKLFLPDEGIDEVIEKIRGCLTVENDVKITIDAGDMEE